MSDLPRTLIIKPAFRQGDTHFTTSQLLTLLSMLLGILTGCAATDTTPVAVAQPIVTATASPSAVLPSGTVTPEATPDTPITLHVWWPDALAPSTQERAALLLADNVETFRSISPDIMVEMRLKRSQGVGGIMETLRTASLVAPTALPDIALVRRADLLTAVRSGYVQSIQGQVTSAVLGDLYPAALDLGRVSGVLYGLAYALDVEHIAYRPAVLTGSFARFEDVLADTQPFVFPAGVTEGLSDVLLLQYLSAGGTLTDLNQGKPNVDALKRVLDFYQRAVAAGVIDPAVLNYARSEDYLTQLNNGQLNAAVVTSTQYLDLLSRGQSLNAAPIPLADGDPATVVNGWMWVVVTRDSSRRQAALRFIEWMVEPDRQATYTRLINMLPSRRAAMRVWDGGDYAALTNQLLLNARQPLLDDGGSATLRAMQNALATVIGGQRTPDEAASDMIEQLAR